MGCISTRNRLAKPISTQVRVKPATPDIRLPKIQTNIQPRIPTVPSSRQMQRTKEMSKAIELIRNRIESRRNKEKLGSEQKIK
jgi:hypothetical protein